MDKEDKQIIDRAIKENWRIGDRTRLKHLLEKNLKLYRENVKLEKENEELEETINKLREQFVLRYNLEDKIEILEKENKLLGERCTQLLKDKGELSDQIADIKANCDLAIEGRDIKIKELTDKVEDLQEQNSQMFNTIALQEQQIEKMKCCCNCDWSNYLPNGNCLDCDGKKNWKLKEIKEND